MQDDGVWHSGPITAAWLCYPNVSVIKIMKHGNYHLGFRVSGLFLMGASTVPNLGEDCAFFGFLLRGSTTTKIFSHETIKVTKKWLRVGSDPNP